MRVAQKLPGVQTFGRESAQAGGSGGGRQRSQYAPMPPRMYENGKKPAIMRIFWLINCRKQCFSLKSTEQDILPRCFLRNALILFFLALLKSCLFFKIFHSAPREKKIADGVCS